MRHYEPHKNYDLIVLLAGEDPTTRLRSKNVLKMFKTGRFGDVLISGNTGGTSKSIPSVSKAEETARFLEKKGIPVKNLFPDGRGLDTYGDLAYPFSSESLPGNPTLDDVDSLVLVSEVGHLWGAGALLSARRVLPKGRFTYAVSEGKFNPGFLDRQYRQSLERAIKCMPEHSGDTILQFLKDEHPFYQEGWFDKSTPARYVTMGLAMAKWTAQGIIRS